LREENLPAVIAVYRPVSVLTKPVLCAVVSFGLIAAGGCDGEKPSSSTRAGGGRSPTVESTEAACAYVEARPSYLPWLDEGEEVPEPQLETENGTSYVMWASGSGGTSQKTVIFRRNSEARGGLGEPVSVRLEGVPGYYYASPGSDGGVLWKTDSDACDLITLAVSLPGSDQAEVREEILKIVESLES
jgi:hypothetical protein